MRKPMLLTLSLALAACDGRAGVDAGTAAAAADDSAFAALQARGAAPEAMGVDQYASAHRFDDTSDGGRIELQHTQDDPASVQQIRSHLQQVARAFAQGDFQIPGFVHDVAVVPGTRVMTQKRALIRYEYAVLPRGGEIRLQASDAEAVSAIHEFLAFQRRDHRAAGHSQH